MIRAIVTDIEGTTTPLAFVKEILFPYARREIGNFVRQHADNPQVSKLLADVCEEVGHPLNQEEIIGQLIDWIDADQKITPLKALQGLIWEQGYRNADFFGQVHEDAQRCLKSWQESGKRLFVYSSGSVYAQKLLFAHTEYGDMTPLFENYFDTRIGAKIEVNSYRNIVTEIGLPAEQILFLSDIEAELEAATEAGLQCRWLVREGEGELQEGAAYPQVRKFTEIRFN